MKINWTISTLICAGLACLAILRSQETAGATLAQQSISPDLEDFRDRLDVRLDLICLKLETRIGNIDPADPKAKAISRAGNTMLNAWVELDQMLPNLSPEALEGVRAVFREASRLRFIDGDGISEYGDPQLSPAGAMDCSNFGYEGGNFGGAIGDLVSDLLSDLADGLDEAGEDPPGELDDLGGALGVSLYPPGIAGERRCGEVQAVLETLADLSPAVSVSVGIIFVDVGVEVPSPLTIIFSVLALFNEFECLEAAADNALLDNCEAANLAIAVDELSLQLTAAQAAIQDQLTSFEANVNQQFEFVGEQFEIVMAQNEDLRVQNCDAIRLLNTPQGQRKSDITTCADQPGWPYAHPR